MINLPFYEQLLPL